MHSASHTAHSTHTHTHLFNGPFSGTKRVGRYQKGKTNLDFTEATDSDWQWHQLRHMQVCTSLQTDNHARTLPLSFSQAGCPSCHPTNSVKTLEALKSCSNRSISPARRANGRNTHTFNGPFSGTTRVSRYQKGKTNLDFTGARDSEWQWHQLGHMQVCPWQETHRILFATLGVLCSCDKACASLVFVVFSQYWFRRQLNGHLFQEA